jgi:hypothetical protein
MPFLNSDILLSLASDDLDRAATVGLTPYLSESIWRSPQKLDYLAKLSESALQFLSSIPNFEFWSKWYNGVKNGSNLDWNLQREVALIPDKEWEQGAEHIARLIREIEARFLVEKLPQAEEVEFNSLTGLFRTVPRRPEKPGLFAATLAQVIDALDDTLANPSNGLSERSREARVIRRALTHYGNDPQQIEMSMVSVQRSLTRQIAGQELPPSEENIALQEATAACARGIRAAHSEIAENRRILDLQALAELSPTDKVKLVEASPVLEAISEADLASDWTADIPAIAAEGTGPPRALEATERNPILAAYDEKVRVFSRIAKIAMLLRRSPDLVHRLHDSAGHKLIVLGMSGTALLAFITYLVTIGIGLL